MTDSMGPYSPGVSSIIDHLESTTQTDLWRRKIVPASPASSAIPPIAKAVPEPNRRLAGSVQASTPGEKDSCNNPIVINSQHHDQSFINSSFSSLVPLQKCIPKYFIATCHDTPATWPLSFLQESITPKRNNLTAAHIPSGSCNSDCLEVRALTKTADSECGSMIAASSAPGTPPELSESRSSKSSSYDSRFSTDHDLATEITNFEDIGLQDDSRSRDEEPTENSRRTKFADRHARQISTSHASCQMKTKLANTTTQLYFTTQGIRPDLASSRSEMKTVSHASQPRSFSPPKRMTRSVTSSSVDFGASAMYGSPHLSAHSRRGSWQPPRKTIEEIEAEYHDSDDELPDDANLWNVPISPFHSTNVSPRTSLRGSPEPQSSSQSLQPLPLEHRQSSPEGSPRQATFPQTNMHQKFPKRSSSIGVSHSHPASPRRPTHIRYGRAKSWNLAMSELSPEAKVISENLESHCALERAKTTEPGEPGRSAVNGSRTSVPSSIQLPPIQRGTLDFMPISKEKEAVLSRTRPSWLPPKCPKEEQKHLREYQRMMAASIEAEKKREVKMKSIQCHNDNTRATLNRIWDFYVNPETDLTVIDRRIYELCWRGIPARLRGKVWQRMISNTLGLNDRSYQKALDRAESIKFKSRHDLSRSERALASWFVDIDRDAETAFPELGVFQRKGPLWQDLVNVCEAYVCYRSDTGYLYGLQLIGALILLQIPKPSEAFIFMANCLNRPTSLAFHTNDLTSTQRTYNRTISSLGIKFPRLHDYLFETTEAGGLGFTGQELFEPMFRTIFANGLDLERLCRAWDIWIFEGDRTLIRTAVAVLGSLQAQILNVNGDVHLKRRNIQEMLGWGPFNRSVKEGCWEMSTLGDEEAFVDEIEAAGKLDYTGR